MASGGVCAGGGEDRYGGDMVADSEGGGLMSCAPPPDAMYASDCVKSGGK